MSPDYDLLQFDYDLIKGVQFDGNDVGMVGPVIDLTHPNAAWQNPPYASRPPIDITLTQLKTIFRGINVSVHNPFRGSRVTVTIFHCYGTVVQRWLYDDIVLPNFIDGTFAFRQKDGLPTIPDTAIPSMVQLGPGEHGFIIHVLFAVREQSYIMHEIEQVSAYRLVIEGDSEKEIESAAPSSSGFPWWLLGLLGAGYAMSREK